MTLRKISPCWRLVATFMLILLQQLPAFSQKPKGLRVTENETFSTGKTRALIIGISKYQYIDSLEYADRDATVFAEYLRNNNFWNIDREEITLLTNDKAKNGDMITQLARIAQVSKPGDNLLFYFSGHGDVETITQFNNGYLLAYDTYSNNYIAGALPISFLKELFVTLLNKEVRVILVTDACRSGKLAGGMKGSEFAASAISAMWKNEIKILSSQPGQLSYEDSKWGNGRGVFSYFLVKGLNGDADANKDSNITLSELEMYVGSNVAKETGNKQQPIFEGPNKFSTIIARVIPREENKNSKAPGNALNNRQSTWNVPDDSCTYYYREMNRAINEKHFDPMASNSATSLYHKLKSCSSDQGFVLRANSELLAALMNNAQEIINNSFVGKKLVGEEHYREGIALLEQVLANNDLKLPYDKHITNLKRYLQVQGEATWNDMPAIDKLETIIDSALIDEPDAAYLLTAKGIVEMRKENWGKAILLLEKAVEKSPGWLIPKYQLGISYANKKNYKKALAYYEEVLQKDSSYKTFECTKCILNNMAEYALELKQDKKALEYLYKSIDAFPDYSTPYNTLYDYAIEKKDTAVALSLVNRFNRMNDTVIIRLMRLRFEREFYGIPFTVKSLDSARILLKDNYDSADYYYTLGFWQKKDKDDEDSAQYYYTKAMETDPADPFYIHELVDFLEENSDQDEIQNLLNSRLSKFSGTEKVELQIKLIDSYFETGSLDEAFGVVKDIKEAGYYTCGDLKSMKKTFGKLPGYQAYMKTCVDKQQAGQ